MVTSIFWIHNIMKTLLKASAWITCLCTMVRCTNDLNLLFPIAPDEQANAIFTLLENSAYRRTSIVYLDYIVAKQNCFLLDMVGISEDVDREDRQKTKNKVAGWYEEQLTEELMAMQETSKALCEPPADSEQDPDRDLRKQNDIQSGLCENLKAAIDNHPNVELSPWADYEDNDTREALQGSFQRMDGTFELLRQCWQTVFDARQQPDN